MDSTGRRLTPARRKKRRAAAALGVLVALSVVPAAWAALSVNKQMNAAKSHMVAAAEAIRRLNPQRAAAQLDSAERGLLITRARLQSKLLTFSRLTPIIRANLRTIEDLAGAGLNAVNAGRAALEMSGPGGTVDLARFWKRGSLDVAGLAEAGRGASRVGGHLVAARRAVDQIPAGWALAPQVRRAKEDFQRMLADARRRTDAASGATFLLSRILGAEGPRSWVIAAQNNAELRGRGGYLGSLGILDAEAGRLSLRSFRAVDALGPLKMDRKELAAEAAANHYLELGSLLAWQNLTMNPHFPSGAKLLLSNLARAGTAAGGLVAVDPVALSYLLEVTGPVSVPGIPEPLTSANFADWTLNRIYFLYQSDNQQRRDTLAATAEAVWKKALSLQGVDPVPLAKALGRGLAEGRVVVYSSDVREQELIERLGIGAAVDDGAGDYLMVVAQNFGENKLDYYLDRQVRYRGRLRTDGTMEVSLQVAVSNRTPAAGSVPEYVGGARPRLGLPPGVARDHFSVFVPGNAKLAGAALDGKPTKVGTEMQRGKKVFGKVVRIPPGETRRLAFRYVVADAAPDGVYSLRLQNQATVRPDRFAVDVDPPPGAVVGKTAGFSNLLRWDGTPGSLTLLSAEVDLPAAPAAVIAGLYVVGIALLAAGTVLLVRKKRPAKAGQKAPSPA